MNDALDWLSLVLRWFHVIAGIMWIGTTYLFNWMERVLDPSTKPNIMGELWMVHGGGFYLVEKQKWPEKNPRVLHWFKWESMLTWLSGMLLLVVVYWAGAPLLEYGSGLTRWQGIGVSAASLILARAAYDVVWRSPLGRSELLGAAVCWALAVFAAWLLGRWLSDRAVFLHIGAMFGTVMVTNVWMTILPNQRKALALAAAGEPPQPELGKRAARCSKHNTYMSVPLIFTMISNHYPMTFGRDSNWIVLAALVLVGFGCAKVVRDHL
ncbi:MAG: urate hydroxylase PuuD [Elusimicrobia bacterium]|nr:urate hydroxylase PuuD [Elusimicrobiota bacterium]